MRKPQLKFLYIILAIFFILSITGCAEKKDQETLEGHKVEMGSFEVVESSKISEYHLKEEEMDLFNAMIIQEYGARIFKEKDEGIIISILPDFHEIYSLELDASKEYFEEEKYTFKFNTPNLKGKFLETEDAGALLLCDESGKLLVIEFRYKDGSPLLKKDVIEREHIKEFVDSIKAKETV